MRGTLVVVNLQAKVAPSHLGENHLPRSEEREDGSSFNSKANKRPEIKKITTVYNKYRPFKNRCQQNQQFPFACTTNVIESLYDKKEKKKFLMTRNHLPPQTPPPLKS